MQRLEILLDAKVINKDTFDMTLNVRRLMKEKYNLTDESMEVMITHFAMMVERLKSGSPVGSMGEEIYNSLKAEKEFELAKEAMESIVTLTEMMYPISEYQFMILHLINSLKGGENNA